MQIERLLPNAAQLHLTHVLITEAAVTLTVTATQPDAACPVCAGVSTRVHSRYHRTLADRPWAGIPVYLHIRVRKFFRPNPHCRRRIFAERVPTIARAWARRTVRLADDQRHLALAHGGEAGARTVAQLGMPTSPDTLLRLMRSASIVAASRPRVLGVDDFAFRKGRTYGTLLVDLEQHQPIDLLPDRTADTLEQWLHAHPGVEVISRDRAGAYAEGAARGAPQAIQVADRFHLVQNLREALQRLLDRQHAALKAASTSPALPSLPDPLPATNGNGVLAPALTRAEQDQAVRRARRHARYEAVRALAGEGWSIRAIAREVHLSRDTIRRFLAASTFPERAQPRPQPSILDAYIPYMRARWQAGCDNGMQLWREIDAQGYPGSRALVARWVAQQRGVLPTPAWHVANRRGRRPAPPRPQPAVRPISARRAAWLLVRRPAELTDAEHGTLRRLLDACPAAATAYPLAQAFGVMARERQGGVLDAWLNAAAMSGVPELHSFVAGVRRDVAAVRAGLTLDVSQGQVEGQVNRLKLSKRSMYGRANFDLLRQRVLAT